MDKNTFHNILFEILLSHLFVLIYNMMLLTNTNTALNTDTLASNLWNRYHHIHNDCM